MFVRLAKVKDCQEIYDLIKDGDSGMTTLPKSKDEVLERISWSKKSLNKKGLSIGYGDGQIIHKEKIIYHANDLRVGLFNE